MAARKRVCAVDLAKVRVGVAVSDEHGMTAHPRPSLDGTRVARLRGSGGQPAHGGITSARVLDTSLHGFVTMD